MSIQAKLHHLQAIQNLLAPYRYLYCVDLEATCDDIGGNESQRSLVVVPDQMETIEIGLVVIDLESLEIVDEFQRFVRPQIIPTLTDFCKKLTSDVILSERVVWYEGAAALEGGKLAARPEMQRPRTVNPAGSQHLLRNILIAGAIARASGGSRFCNAKRI
ncbi:exonuclease domain-containing protein [Pseudomonas umsongensis]|uniref:exonuclease domain-containing protein n=1 Tax=Pseudomonas umsongensis TaxID=198618 RepID=UPI001CDB9933|nr:exonuclease domain-containing protein [Pseudomonas umsongensis]